MKNITLTISCDIDDNRFRGTTGIESKDNDIVELTDILMTLYTGLHGMASLAAKIADSNPELVTKADIELVSEILASASLHTQRHLRLDGLVTCSCQEENNEGENVDFLEFNGNWSPGQNN